MLNTRKAGEHYRMKFSIIIPVFNSDSYLHECVHSVLEQTCADWEMILVDDGSTDQSGDLADIYAQTDSRIKVIHKQNAGQLRARQDGIRIAEGEYILFLDSDDYWRQDCLETLLRSIESKKPDVIMFPAKRIDNRKCESRAVGVVSDCEHWLEKNHVYWTLISGVAYNSMCLKAWKRELFEADTTDYKRFTGACWGEDKAQLLHPITKAHNILYIPEELYYYRYNPASVIQNSEVQKIPGMISNHVFELLYEYMHRWDMVNTRTTEAIAVSYLRNYMTVYFRLRKLCRNGSLRKQFRSVAWDEIVCPEAFRYACSKSFTAREKLKLFVARYLRAL